MFKKIVCKGGDAMACSDGFATERRKSVRRTDLTRMVVVGVYVLLTGIPCMATGQEDSLRIQRSRKVGQADEVAGPRTYFAGIAIDHYDPEGGWPTLYGTNNDLDSISGVLSRHYGVEVDERFILRDTAATATGIEIMLRELVRRMRSDPEARLVFYFAGHGDRSEDSWPYMIPSDGKPPPAETGVLLDPREAIQRLSWYPIQRLLENLALPGRHQVLVIIDACQAGSMSVRGFEDANPPNNASLEPSHEVVAAGQYGQDVREQAAHGIFTSALVNSLRLFASRQGNGAEFIAIELFEHVQELVDENAEGVGGSPQVLKHGRFPVLPTLPTRQLPGRFAFRVSNGHEGEDESRNDAETKFRDVVGNLEENDARELRIGDEVESRLTMEDMVAEGGYVEVWRIAVGAGDSLVIAVEGEEYDPDVYLLAPGSEASEGIDDRAGVNGRRFVVASKSGVYYIIVSDTDGGGGYFRLRANRWRREGTDR